MERQYLGEIITSQNYKEILEKEGREGINFRNKHLKMYERGVDSFYHGKEEDENGDLRPRLNSVEQRMTLSFEDKEGNPQVRTFRSQAAVNGYLRKKSEEKFGKSK